MRTESGVRARSDNPRSRSPAPDSLRVELRSTIETATAPGGPPTAFHLSLVGGRPCRLVPLAGAGREVADRDLKAGVVGQALQLDLPQADATGVRATAVGGDLQGPGSRVARLAELLPPAADRGDRERRGLLGDPDVHEPVVGADVIDAVGDRLAERLVGEVVHVDRDRLALGSPLPPAVCALADELLLLGIDADRRPALRDRGGHLLVDMPELRVAVGMRSCGWPAGCSPAGATAARRCDRRPRAPSSRKPLASSRTLLDVHNNGRSGSPRVSLSTSRPRSESSVSSVSVRRWGPPPALRTRPAGSCCGQSSSRNPLRIVFSASPLARTTAVIPPRPCERASAAAQIRR